MDKICDNCLYWNPCSKRCHHPKGHLAFAYAFMTCSGWKDWNADPAEKAKQYDRIFHEARREAMKDDARNVADKAARRVISTWIKRQQDTIAMGEAIDDLRRSLEWNELDPPDPRDELCKAAVGMAGRRRGTCGGGAFILVEQEPYERLEAAVNAYRQSLEEK